jgi:hypothetical protein
MSYDPSLSYTKAEQLLVSTATDGNLNVAAAFDTDGLGAIVAQGTASIPQAPAPTSVSQPAAGHLTVLSARWGDGVLTLDVRGLAGNELSVELEYPHKSPRYIATPKQTVRIPTTRPRLVLLRVMMDKKQLEGPITVHPT